MRRLGAFEIAALMTGAIRRLRSLTTLLEMESLFPTVVKIVGSTCLLGGTSGGTRVFHFMPSDASSRL